MAHEISLRKAEGWAAWPYLCTLWHTNQKLFSSLWLGWLFYFTGWNIWYKKSIAGKVVSASLIGIFYSKKHRSWVLSRIGHMQWGKTCTSHFWVFPSTNNHALGRSGQILLELWSAYFTDGSGKVEINLQDNLIAKLDNSILHRELNQNFRRMSDAMANWTDCHDLLNGKEICLNGSSKNWVRPGVDKPWPKGHLWSPRTPPIWPAGSL